MGSLISVLQNYVMFFSGGVNIVLRVACMGLYCIA